MSASPVPTRFSARPYDYAEARLIADELGLSEPVAITLVRRGYRTPEEARAFLAADETHDAGALRRDRAAVSSGSSRRSRPGSGSPSTATSTSTASARRRSWSRRCARCGAECDWLIPDRLADGYGLSAGIVEALAERGTRSAGHGRLRDHRASRRSRRSRRPGSRSSSPTTTSPARQLPDCPILHPEVSGYPFETLCGTAVAGKLA